jgi:uncharacterized repeat protein (TIGR01451 family)
MSCKQMGGQRLRYASVGGALLWTANALAAGTPAGTAIQNTAQINYTVGGSSINVSSNTTTLTVAEILNVNVVVQTPTVSVAPGATQRVVVMRVTNTGNGAETFNLIANSNVAGDDFDPTLASPAVFFDSDGSGDLSPADVAYVPGTNDPVLNADQFVTVLIVNSIGNGLANGAAGRTQLTARAATGTGVAGTVFAGQGVGGVDAVVGTSTASQIGVGAYIVAGLQLNAVKSQTVADQFGGTRPVPGARINYQIVITPTGTGTAAAVLFTDAIPANTTYVAGTLRLNSAALSDASDADAGQFATAPTAQVRINLGDLTAASGTQTVEFAVTIN